jgi:prevent-host-death family protein
LCSGFAYIPGADRPISAAEANRSSSRLLREVRGGQSFVVTAHGRPVARIVPYEPEEAARRAAREALFARLDAQRPAEGDGARWTRDEPYGRGG